ncbi:MAG: hypothetical protein J0M18_13505 [Ignavibacteria bacterium]|nr:hypothetical protein [Ignavibacteria bacterium]
MENIKLQTPTEKFYLEKNQIEKIAAVIGALCFITSCVLVITYSGFTAQPQGEIKVVLIPDIETLWIINAILGIAGGALLNYKKFLAAIPAGLAAVLFMTDFTLFYISFRDSIMIIEILLPLFLAFLVGAGVYKVLYKLIYKKKDDEILKGRVNTELKN